MARNKYDIDEALESPFDARHLKRALVYAGKYKAKIVLGLLLSVMTAGTQMLFPLIARRAIDDAIPNGNVPLLLILGASLFAAIAFGVFFSQRRSIIMTKVGQNIICDIREDLFAKLQQLPFDYYDSRPHGKILVRIINYVNSISDLMTNGIINFVLEALNIVLITIFMFFVSWRLALVIAAGLPLFLGIMLFIKNKQRRAWQDESNKSSNLNAYLHESIVGVKISQIFTREDKNAEIFNNLSDAYRKSWMKAVTYSFLVWPTTDILFMTTQAAVYLFGLVIFAQYYAVTATLGTVVAMVNYANMLWQPIQRLSNLMNTFITATAYLERIFEMLDEPVTVSDADKAGDMPPVKGDVKFDNVTFFYEEGVNILENLSFTVKAGESIALVGPTGAGKTTIVSLISRFYNISGGQVLIDDVNIAEVKLNSLRKQMGIMLQDSFIFSGTIMFNIKYGRRDASDEEAYEACRIVGIDDYIRSLKDGYNTEVKERGAGLSQGQKQLISFARTILADPKILVLDEATSSIDAKTERYLQNGLSHLLKGRTSFVIAHRLSTIRNCDKIMYVSDKGITECGSHRTLMEKKGDYYKLYTTQSGEAKEKILQI